MMSFREKGEKKKRKGRTYPAVNRPTMRVPAMVA